MVERILQTLVDRLAESELIELAEDCSVEDLSHELITPARKRHGSRHRLPQLVH